MEIFFEDQGVGVVHKELTMYDLPKSRNLLCFLSSKLSIDALYLDIYLCTSNLFVLYLGVRTLEKQGHVHSKQGSFGFQLYISI